jgi:hypothetical protein
VVVATCERMTVAGEAAVRASAMGSVEFLPADPVGDLFAKP